jgi:hypothetical protein
MIAKYKVLGVTTLALGAFAVGACGDRPDEYDAPIADGQALQTLALENEVAVVDRLAHRVVLLTPRLGQELDRKTLTTGKGVLRAEASPDRKRLFVLSAGEIPRRKPDDEKASLTIIEDGRADIVPLESPHSGFAVDPLGKYVALFAAPAQPQTTFIENPNEIVVVDLADRTTTPRTIRSFGGRPQRVSFTPLLQLPGGPRRLLIVETEQDVHLLDLDNIKKTPRRPEVTVRLTSGATAAALRPAAVVVDDGEPGKTDDARIGVRIEGNSNVFTLTLVPETATASAEPGTEPNDFRPEINLTDVGGVPGDIVFVRTDVGLRLAAVVPNPPSAVLVDPSTSIATKITLPEPYERISLITNVVASAGGADTTLLYGASGSRGVAFWSLGRATGTQSYRSVEVVSLGSSVRRLVDVPPPRPELKVLDSGASSFFVLNLASRTASPLTTLAAPSLHIAPDGQRLWAFSRGSFQLAQVKLEDLHPIQLPIDRPIDAVFDVARREGGRALVAIDARGGVGATVIDALEPDTVTSRSYYGLLLEDL